MQQNKILPPPWLVFTELEQSSPIWRTGTDAEQYLTKWYAWFKELSPADYREYANLFPEPFTWVGALEQYRGGNSASGERVRRSIEKEQKARTAPSLSREKLARAFAAGETRSLCFFWGHQPSRDGALTRSCFSQWWKSDFFCRGQSFCCMEQMMMACKARLFRDEAAYQKIMQSDDPAKMKKYGRQVQNFAEAVWNKHKYFYVLAGNYCKFASSPALREFLLSTGDQVLVEASPYDCIWGIGLDADNPHAADPAQWRGENLLGFALTQVREEIKMVFANASLCCDPWEN